MDRQKPGWAQMCPEITMKGKCIKRRKERLFSKNRIVCFPVR
jgi:hypothetical protein